MTETTLITATLTTDCTCEAYNEETGEYEAGSYSDTCFGCYDTDWDDFIENIYNPWLSALGADDSTLIRIDGTGMGWQRRAGWASVSARDIHSAMTINGEWRIEYRFDGTALTAVRWSHDEPTGTGVFTFTLDENNEDAE
jgi:hypothetical protein